jgi:hypothetical protein
MKATSAALAQHIDQECTTLAMCVKLILTKYQPQILRIYQLNPCVVETLWAHDYIDGDTIRIVGVRGMTALNHQEFTILRLNDYQFQINVDASAFPPYEGKGEARKVIAFTQFVRDLTLDF